MDLKVSVGPTLTRRSKVELKNKTWNTYQELAKRNIEVSITTDHPYTPIQYLNVCAAIAVREGLIRTKSIRRDYDFACTKLTIGTQNRQY